MVLINGSGMFFMVVSCISDCQGVVPKAKAFQILAKCLVVDK